MALEDSTAGPGRKPIERRLVYLRLIFTLLPAILARRRPLRLARRASARLLRSGARRHFAAGNRIYLSTVVAVLVPVWLVATGSQVTSAPDPFARWGDEVLAQIRSALRLPDSQFYAEEVTEGRSPSRPARLWSGSILLSALAAAARVERQRYEPALREYADALRAYWTQQDGIGGYDVLPNFPPGDRFYDDNAWMSLALAETFEVTGDAKYLRWSRDALAFVLSGEDNRLDGGIYWREQSRTTKNTASTAPAALAALRLYLLTNEQHYLDTGTRLYTWTRNRLQDSDGLFSDHVRLDGQVDATRWSYNSGIMLSANSTLFGITGERQYLERAERLARSSEARWVRPATGAFADEAQFAVLLMEGFLAVHEQDRDARWLVIARRGLTYLHDSARDSYGNYGRHWDAPPSDPLDKIRLKSLGPAARGYYVVARYSNQSAK